MRWVVVSAGSLLLLLNMLSAFIATRPALQARLFGANGEKPHDPSDVGLDYERVAYGAHRWGWWIGTPDAKGSVVIVHGFSLSSEPVRDSPGPLLQVAKLAHERGYNAFMINLGYATGAHHYTGGRAEADDIELAARWAKRHACGPVIVWGFSAGAHDSLIAAARSRDIAGVAADSAFVNTADIVQQQSARTVHAPRPFFALVPWFFGLSGGRDVDAVKAWHGRPRKPVLIIHGLADTAISPSNAKPLAEATHGTVWMVPGADHLEAYDVSREEYESKASGFLARFHRERC